MTQEHLIASSSRRLRIFLCHASEDKEKVRTLYTRVEFDGFAPWLDVESLRAGQDWENEIAKEIHSSEVVIVCLSRAAVKKEKDKCSVFSQEIRMALVEQKRRGGSFVVPIMFEECNVPDELAGLQAVKIAGDKDYQKRLGPVLKMRRQQLEARVTAHRRVTGHDRRSLRDLIGTIGISQKGLSDLAGVKTQWLSQVLRGQRETADREMLERVAHELIVVVTDSRADGSLSEERTQAALAFLNRLKKTVVGSAVTSYERGPGGPLPLEHAQYVKRGSVDRVITALDLKRMPFYMKITGPVQCGKSSLLSALAQRALGKGIETASFDPAFPLPPVSRGARLHEVIDARASVELSKRLQAEWGLNPPQRRRPIKSITEVLNWLLLEIEPNAEQQRLLVLDDLASLGAYVGKLWLYFIKGIQDEEKRLRISVAVGLTEPSEIKHTHSSSEPHWPREFELKLNWFGRTDVSDLLRAVTGSRRGAHDLFKLFGGQPYLTHEAATNADFRNDVSQWINDRSDASAERVRMHAAYEEHRQAIESAILVPTAGNRAEQARLLNAFIDVCDGREIWLPQDHKDFFKRAKLLDDSGKPTLEIYRLIGQDLREKS